MLNIPPPLESTFFKCQLVEIKYLLECALKRSKTSAIWEYDASNQGFPAENISQKFFDVTNPGKVLLEPRVVDQKGQKSRKMFSYDHEMAAGVWKVFCRHSSSHGKPRCLPTPF